MDKYSAVVQPSEGRGERRCADAANSIEADFGDLIAILDRELATLPIDETQARTHIAQAKAAAQRGLRVSQELVAIVQERTDRS